MRKGVGSHGLRGLRGAAIPPPVHGERRRRVGAADRYRGVHPADSHARRRPACSPSGHLAEQWPTHACARSGEVHVAERGGGTPRHSAALRGTPRHFAALRGTPRHSAALRGTVLVQSAPASGHAPASCNSCVGDTQCPNLPDPAGLARQATASSYSWGSTRTGSGRIGRPRIRHSVPPVQGLQDQRTGPGSGGGPDTGPTEAGPRAH